MSALSAAVQTRVAVGFIVQPVVAAVTAAIIFFPFVYLSTSADSAHHHVVAIGFAMAARIGIVVGFAGVPLTVVAFAALIALLKLSVRVGFSHALAAGVLIGNLPFVLIASLNWSAQPDAGMPFHPSIDAARDAALHLSLPVLFAALIGTACAVAFWQIAGSSLDCSAGSGPN